MKFFFAAMESFIGGPRSLVPEPHSNLFFSYMKPEESSAALKWLHTEKGHRGLRVIDSGAFTYLSVYGKSPVARTMGLKKTIQLKPIRQYFSDYIVWLLEHIEMFDYFVEIDLQEIYGYELIEEFREGYRSAGLNHKCIHVLHTGDGREHLDRIIDRTESRYLACESIRVKDGAGALPYMEILERCYREKVKVHGFALTRSDLLLNLPFYSVDSSSWTSGIQYGTGHVFEKGRLRSHSLKDVKQLQRHGAGPAAHSRARGYGADMEKLKYAELEFLKMEKWITDIWTSRGVIWEE